MLRVRAELLLQPLPDFDLDDGDADLDCSPVALFPLSRGKLPFANFRSLPTPLNDFCNCCEADDDDVFPEESGDMLHFPRPEADDKEKASRL